MLEVGNSAMKHDEYLTHMSLWALLAAPLLAGNDLRTMNAETKEIRTNSEVIAVDQDTKGIQEHRMWNEGPLEIWAKQLSTPNIREKNIQNNKLGKGVNRINRTTMMIP